METNTDDNISEEEIIDTTEFDELGEDEGGGSYCCGKRMVERSIVFICLKCGAWEYSSS